MKANQRYKQVLDFIKSSIDYDGEAPTIREIRKYTGLRSPASVHEILLALENLGLIKRTRKHRGIELV